MWTKGSVVLTCQSVTLPACLPVCPPVSLATCLSCTQRDTTAMGPQMLHVKGCIDVKFDKFQFYTRILIYTKGNSTVHRLSIHRCVRVLIKWKQTLRHFSSAVCTVWWKLRAIRLTKKHHNNSKYNYKQQQLVKRNAEQQEDKCLIIITLP